MSEPKRLGKYELIEELGRIRRGVPFGNPHQRQVTRLLAFEHRGSITTPACRSAGGIF